MQQILQNLPLICFIAVILIIIIYGAYMFYTWPKEAKKQALAEWLKWAVSQAEKELGGGTGQLKLRKVYEMALEKFPWLVECFSFEEFSAYVDVALAWLTMQMAQNKSILTYVKEVE